MANGEENLYLDFLALNIYPYCLIFNYKAFSLATVFFLSYVRARSIPCGFYFAHALDDVR